MPHSNINQFFAKTCLSKWNNVSIFVKFIYNESHSTTPKQVLDMYNRNRFDIISAKDTKNNVMQYVRDIIVKIEVCFYYSLCLLIVPSINPINLANLLSNDFISKRNVRKSSGYVIKCKKIRAKVSMKVIASLSYG